MKRKMFGAAIVAMTAATLATPSTVTAAECQENLFTCAEEGVDLAQAKAREGAETAGGAVVTACRIVLPGC